MEKHVKIAFCISGQPRTWKRAYPTWFEHLSHLGDIDVFYHMWDFNTHPSMAVVLKPGQPLQENQITVHELQEIHDLLKPKKYQIQGRRNFVKPSVKNPIALWTRPQFYGIRKAAFLKREYEIENNFEYDLVFRLRTDLVLTHKINIEYDITPNTLYTCMNNYDPEYETFRVGDIFYFADSYTYDQISNFYYGLDYIDATWPLSKTGVSPYPPELAFYYYMKTLNVSNFVNTIDCKVARDVEYQALKGHLDGYETL